MVESKRHRDILKLLQQDGTLSIADLAGRLGVSLETIRRDLKPLADRHTIVRMHGAVALPSIVGEAPFERRLRENAQAKKAIARTLAATIRDGDSIMLDTGTTTSILARELLGHRRLTVITNSSDIARTLATSNENRVYMAGGELRSDNGAAFGSTAIDFISRFHVLHAVISVGAVSAGSGILDFDFEEAEFARTLLTRGDRRIAVTDQSKFNRSGLVKVCDFSDLTDLVTDGTPPQDVRAALETAGVTCTIARPT
ncbi:DeoR/GlpR family DNA-binding transcription regulator [Rhizobium sp. SL42]|uniref:DeoR/GlpR family DNA-binding transcription regulator n=1 Tax=Rhizobium sp. SL42 TaxID=2806346 RepID=UPI001F158D45|nr:DeoR/GlpR family DNA-binding transcription regulator [Rhizobium sp. SL42]UJW74833.1 DeoR/GlpR transcriptional regulator [Rhizobium sp. SL42]